MVEDDDAVAEVICRILRRASYQTHRAIDGATALAWLRCSHADLVLSDIRMPGMDGMQLLTSAKAEWPDLPVILMTAHGSVPLAVEAMKAGAEDFVLKPFERDEVLRAVDKAVQLAPSTLHSAPDACRTPSDALRLSPSTRHLAREIELFGAKAPTVLIVGETGCGKEVVARAIHARHRPGGPFIAFNCAAIPDTLIESELFGYEKGAFTGAAATHLGRFELADGGTLLLDEIGEASASLQAKLLRVLESRSFERVGGGYSISVQLHVIAATHRDLEQMVADGTFRRDLYYRLSGFTMRTLPLRQRPDDIAELANAFLSELSVLHGRHCTLDEDALKHLRQHRWPGNVRELRNLMERLVVMNDAGRFSGADVIRELNGPTPVQSPMQTDALPDSSDGLDVHRGSAERAAILHAIDRAGGNKALAARMLQISRRTLYNKMALYGLHESAS